MNAVVKTIEAYSALRSSAVAVAFSSCGGVREEILGERPPGRLREDPAHGAVLREDDDSASNCCVNRADIR